jgi:hypothetical protein
MEKERENWVKWLQARIPELKKPHNEYWLRLALDGYLESKKGGLKCSCPCNELPIGEAAISSKALQNPYGNLGQTDI